MRSVADLLPDDLFSVRHSGLGTNETGDRAASHNPARRRMTTMIDLYRRPSAAAVPADAPV